MSIPVVGKRKRAKRKKMPKHQLELRSWRYPLDVSHAQEQILFGLVDLCWEIRNLLVAERIENRLANRIPKAEGKAVHYLNLDDQHVRVSQLQKADPRYAAIHSQVLQNVARRVDEGTKRWLENLQAKGERKVNPPHFIERRDYNSFTFTQCGNAIGIWDGKVHLSKLGSFKLIQFRKYRGQPKTLTIKWEEGQWWAILVCALQGKAIYRDQALVEHLQDIGGDPGLKSLLTLADGEVFDPPKALKDALTALRHEQRLLSRKFRAREAAYNLEAERLAAAKLPPQAPLRETPYSNRLRAQIRKVAILHTKVARVREYHHRKLARRLERTYRNIAVEEHGIQFMLANRKTARAAADRALAAMKGWLASTIGPRLTLTPNRRPGIGGNSQTCLCNHPVPKTLKDREHVCPKCGLVAPRDVVSANIVMQIAFGKNLLVPRQAELKAKLQTAAGQAVVGRGGDEDVRPLPSVEPMPSVKDGKESASENPWNRQPLASQRSFLKTWGGEPTQVAQSARIIPGGIVPGVLLDAALGVVSGDVVPAVEKRRPSGR